MQVSGNSKVIDERVYKWFANAHCQNIPISSPILQTKALQVAANIGLNDFRASNGWLDGGILQAPLYTISFAVWRKCWNG